MAEVSSLPPSLQESILAAIVFDDKWGSACAMQLSPEYFDEGAFREIAEKLLSYRAQFHKPPGRVHLDDLFGSVLFTRDNQPSKVQRTLAGIAALQDGLNGEYIAGQVQEFVRKQQLKSALLEASARYEQGGPDLTEEVEKILYSSLRHRVSTMDAGTFLNDPDKAFAFLDRRDTSDYIPLGIGPLDDIGIRLIPKEMLLFIGPKGRGKTWFCIHCGKQALLQKARVLHVTLEVREEIVVSRYFQALFGGAYRPDPYDVTLLELDDLKRFVAMEQRKRTPKFAFSDPNIRKILRAKMAREGVRLGRIVVKEFPTSALTIPTLENYLDFLETTHKFIPQVLIIDYPDLMNVNKKDYRIGLRHIFESLRGIATQRNLALVVPTQGNRSSLDARKVKAGMVSEDISKINTADVVMTLSSTGEERKRGLARLHLAHSRNTADDETVLITQSYKTGQFCLQAIRPNTVYFTKLKAIGDKEDPHDDDT